jgi:hypothetical protein
MSHWWTIAPSTGCIALARGQALAMMTALSIFTVDAVAAQPPGKVAES